MKLSQWLNKKNRAQENRQIGIVRNSAWFDERWYVSQYQDVFKKLKDPARHYYQKGWKENRDPSENFSTAAYLRQYPECEICPLVFEHNRNERVDLSACVIVKNEAPYIKEWLDYHLLVGVKRFYIYDNESTDNLKEVLAPYIARGLVVYKYYPGEAKQMSAYNECIREYKDMTEWLAVIDVDEFIIPTEKDSIPEFLKDFKDCPGVGINWISFDGNDYKKQPDGGVLENYTRVHYDDQFSSNHHIKSIVRPEMVEKYTNPHYAVYIDGKNAVDENGNELRGCVYRGVHAKAYTDVVSVNKIRINHYYCKSEEEYRAKLARGRALTKGGKKQFSDKALVFDDIKYDCTAYKYAEILYPEAEQRLNTKELYCKIKNFFIELKHIGKLNGLFDYVDEKWYFEQYPDAKESGMTALQHYLSIGWKEGKNPSKYFDTNFYLSRYPDIADGKTNPLLHYLTAGKSAGRLPKVESGIWADVDTKNLRIAVSKVDKTSRDYKLLDASELFDKEWYVNTYLNGENIDPVAHYLCLGWQNGCNPSKDFDTEFYLKKYKDVAKSGQNPLLHYIKHGKEEGRSPKFNGCWLKRLWKRINGTEFEDDIVASSQEMTEDYKIVENSKLFKQKWYARKYLQGQKINPIEHYLTIGWKAGNKPNAEFDTEKYLSENPDCRVCPVVFEYNRNEYADLAICAIMKNEAPYVKEWLDYHRLVGVRRFYIYDNESTDNMKEVLDPYIKKGIVVYEYAPGNGVQRKVYNECLKKYGDKTKWMAFIDADEFIVPKEKDSITEFLKDYEKYSGVGINWVNFDSNGHLLKPRGGVLENYSKVYYEDGWWRNHNIKSIVKPCDVKIMNVHRGTFTNGKYAVDENKKQIADENYLPYVSVNKIQINHYYCKSAEEATAKMARGVAILRDNKIKLIKQEELNFEEYKYDYNIYKYLLKLKPEIAGSLKIKRIWLKFLNTMIKIKYLFKKDEIAKYIDENWYFAHYPEAEKSGLSARQHYLQIGWEKGYNPSEKFDTEFYMKKYPETTKIRICPLLNYLAYGKYEGREVLPDSNFEGAVLDNNEYVDLSVCTIMKNEAPYVKEWLDYHLSVGVKRFYIYDNESTDNLKKVLDPYIAKGLVVYKYYPGEARQMPAYNECIKEYKDKTEWLAVIDADEFIMPIEKDSIPEFLKEFKDCPGVGINWFCYDSNGHKHKPQRGLLESYTRVHFDDQYSSNHHIKSIVRPEKVEVYANPHYAQYFDDKNAVDENGNEMKGCVYRDTHPKAFTDIVSVNKIRINHYYCKSEEEYRAKLARGRAPLKGKKRQFSLRSLIFEDVKYDYTAYKYAEKLYPEAIIRLELKKLWLKLKNAVIKLKHFGKPCRMFDYIDENWYFEQYPDAKESGMTAVQHYLSIGWKEGKNPSKYFDTNFYLNKYKDIARAEINPLLHYITVGKNAGRLPMAKQVLKTDEKQQIMEKDDEEISNDLSSVTPECAIKDNSVWACIRKWFKKEDKYNELWDNEEYFDEEWYISQYPEAIDYKGGVKAHYRTEGWQKGYNPSEKFNTNEYLKQYPECKICPIDFEWNRKKVMTVDELWYFDQYPEAKESGLSAKEHYNTIGWKKGYNPNMEFDTVWYLTKNTDVAKVGMNPLKHYLNYGVKEKRTVRCNKLIDKNKILSEYFDEKWYCSQYSDVKTSGLLPIEHYNTIGWKKGYNPSRYFNTNFYLKKYPFIIENGLSPLEHFVKCGYVGGSDTMPENSNFYQSLSFDEKKMFLSKWFRKTKEVLNLDNPFTFNEKMQWIKLYDSTPIKTKLADKYLVRDWVKEKIGEKYLIPLLGVYDSFDEIDFDKLPKQFVVKCNHSSGTNIIVKDKTKLDLADTKKKLDSWMRINPAYDGGFQFFYSAIPHKIVVEKFIENKKSEDLNDYKFYCFNGEVKYTQVISERTSNTHKVSFYDMNWEKQPWWDNDFYEGVVEKPQKFTEMVEIVKKLCEGFCFVRVDLYYLDTGEIYFGEMTFTPGSGVMKWSSSDINNKLGNMIKLPKLAYNVDTGSYFKLPIECGEIERRDVPSDIVKYPHYNNRIWNNKDYFDESWYLSQYHDVKKGGIYARQHYNKIGWKKGYNPSAKFNTNAYMKQHPECEICPLTFEQNRSGYVDLSICAIMKNEASYIKEWIDYYRMQGCKRFYIYDNESTDNLTEVLAPYIKQGVVVYKYYPGRYKEDRLQFKAYQECVDNYKNDTEWLAIIDPDEYIIPLKNKTIPEFMNDYKKEAGIVINWVCYDSNGHIERPKGGVLENYTKVRRNYYNDWNSHVKSIINPRKVRDVGVHISKFINNELPVDEYFKPVPHSYTNSVSIDKIRINHYWTKSQSEFLKKTQRQRNSGSFSIKNKELYDFPEYLYDYIMWKYVVKLGYSSFVKEFVKYVYLRLINIWIKRKPMEIDKFFNEKYYCKKYGLKFSSHNDAYYHYVDKGWKLGYNPSKEFDTNFYLDRYPDIKQANINPLMHYINVGKFEGRKISKVFEYEKPFLKELWKKLFVKKLQNPKISIIVASYNYEQYIRETLDSLINQTYRNFEVIVVDDGSKDNSVNVIKEYTDKFDNVFLYTHKNGQNKGLVETVKLGISKATGEYIAFCESDDYWVPNHLEEKVKLINKYFNPEIIANDVELFDHPTEEYISYLDNGLRTYKDEIIKINVMQQTYNPMATFSCIMIRRDVLSKCNFDSVIPAWTDWWLYRQILVKCPLYFVNQRLTMWRIHDSYNTTERNNKYAEKYNEFMVYNNSLLAKKCSYVNDYIRNGNDYKTVNNSGLFDEKFYRRMYPEMASLNIPAIYHFNMIGWKKGYSPSNQFDAKAYLNLHKDIKIANINPLLHYINVGKEEGRNIVSCDYKPTVYKSNKKKSKQCAGNILLVSHMLNHTGAPILLKQVAELLISKHYMVTIMSPIDGDLRDEIIALGCDVIIDTLAYADESYCNKYKNYNFDFCICNTYLNAYIYSYLSKFTPSIMWIHDNLNEQQANSIMPVLSTSKDIYAASKLTKSYMMPYNENIKILGYPAKDVVKHISKKSRKSHKPRIAVCAALQSRKGQDIFVEAVRMLPDSVRQSAEFLLLGEEGQIGYREILEGMCKDIPEITFVDAIKTPSEYHKFIDGLDILCCPSREDPCPLVVLDAFMHGVPVIISDHVGQKDIIQDKKDGYIFKNEDIEELSQILEHLIVSKEYMHLRTKSRKIFDRNYSDKTFLNDLFKIMEEKCAA